MKSHFLFTKQQRHGIFLLVFIIVVLQISYLLFDFSSEKVPYNQEAYALYSKEIDSLRQIEIALQKTKIFPFNPNFISDYKGSVLGMSNEEIDRLLAYREQNQWINSAKQFQEVTKVSDSLLALISPYFKFPDGVKSPRLSAHRYDLNAKPKTVSQKLDLNTATAQQLQKVIGVGEVLSQRIIKYRNKFVGGFIADVQLRDIYGLSPEVIKRITNDFAVKTPRPVEKIDLNTATIEELVTIQHIDYDVASSIIEERTLRDGFTDLEELKKVKGFPINKLEIIKLYLSLEKENR
ncbi:ComEA family DNA-binding protein [Aestuariivivens sediminis]|uniref:ComEA family DNA-binding protein n=1 Tax=Aestuariivivens sediminis TaxID=2913557 RepID=UPI001F578110|nr:helix-hairpin-helix domain-containing protein [Aestuariivivens sediminis]